MGAWYLLLKNDGCLCTRHTRAKGGPAEYSIHDHKWFIVYPAPKVTLSSYIFWISSSSRNHTEGFQGFLEIPWKFLEISNHSNLALIYNSLEICTLILALKFKVFQGQLHFPLEIFQLPSTLKTLENFWKGHLDLDWTLNFKVNFKEPWNSRLRLSSLLSLQPIYASIHQSWIQDFINVSL